MRYMVLFLAGSITLSLFSYASAQTLQYEDAFLLTGVQDVAL